MLTKGNLLLLLLALGVACLCAVEGLPGVDFLSRSLRWESAGLSPLTLASYKPSSL